MAGQEKRVLSYAPCSSSYSACLACSATISSQAFSLSARAALSWILRTSLYQTICFLSAAWAYFCSVRAKTAGAGITSRRKQIQETASSVHQRGFQSTLPARGATKAFLGLASCCRNFNPRSPHGERPHLPRQQSHCADDFNPRSPHGERLRKVTILSIRIIDFAQKVYHKTVLLRISLAENAVILPEKPRNPVRTSLQKAGGLRFARAIRAARPYSISSPSGA